MTDLFFSLSSSILFLALFKEKKSLVEIKKENFRKHSENFFFYLREILNEAKCDLKDIRNFYFTAGPGGQTGIRISLSFISAMKILSPNSKFYWIDTLYFQAKGESKKISLLSLDRKGNK
jgi:tRNA A37 threonylcarbamoyladenosine modification protein TsaB